MRSGSAEIIGLAGGPTEYGWFWTCYPDCQQSSQAVVAPAS